MDLANIMIGGSLWLNLTNTTYMNNGEQQDLLQNPEAVAQWLLESSLIHSSDLDLINMKALTEQLVFLRSLCFTILHQINENPTTIDLEPLNCFFKKFSLKVEVKWNKERAVSSYMAGNKEENILYQIAISLVKTLEEAHISRIRQCEHGECILNFVDTSKAGKRRWCSMETCGNRHKAAEFYRKKKENI